MHPLMARSNPSRILTAMETAIMCLPGWINDDIYGQRFWSEVKSFGTYGSNYNATDNNDYRQDQPSVALKNNRIIST